MSKQIDLLTLRRDLSKVVEGLATSGPLDITRYGKVVGRLVPADARIATITRVDAPPISIDFDEAEVEVRKTPQQQRDEILNRMKRK